MSADAESLIARKAIGAEVTRTIATVRTRARFRGSYSAGRRMPANNPIQRRVKNTATYRHSTTTSEYIAKPTSPGSQTGQQAHIPAEHPFFHPRKHSPTNPTSKAA